MRHLFVFLFSIGFFLSAQVKGQTDTVSKIEFAGETVIHKGVPLLFPDTLLFLYSRTGSFSPAERVAAVNERLNQLVFDPFFIPDSLYLSENEFSSDIMFSDRVIMSVTDNDVVDSAKSRKQVSGEYLVILKNALEKQKQNSGFRNLLKRIGMALFVILVFFLLILLINKFFRFIAVKVRVRKDLLFKGVTIFDYEFLDSNRQMNVAFLILKVLKLIVIIVTFYLVLPVLFSIFPWTEGLAKKLIGYFVDPVKNMALAFLHYIPDLFTIIVIVLIGHYVVKFLSFISWEIENEKLKIRGFYPDWAKPTFRIFKVLIYSFIFIVIFPYLPGSNSPIFRGVSIFIGVLFSLGSSTAISNIVAGLVITYMRPFKLGDRIKIGEVVGEVTEKNLLVTRIRTIKNEDITVPNSNILSSHSINYSTSAQNLGLILHTTVTIGYDVPWREVHKLLIQAAKNTEGISLEKEPYVLQTSLDDFYVSYQLNAYTSQPVKMAALYSNLHQNIQDFFKESGIEIMSPHYRATRDGNASTIPVDTNRVGEE